MSEDRQDPNEVEGRDARLAPASDQLGRGASVASSPVGAAAAPMIRVLVADDHAIFRLGLKRVLEAAPDIAVVAEAASGEEALARRALAWWTSRWLTSRCRAVADSRRCGLPRRAIRECEIAARLHVSRATVQTCRARILRRLHLATNGDLILYALRAGLVLRANSWFHRRQAIGPGS